VGLGQRALHFFERLLKGRALLAQLPLERARADAEPLADGLHARLARGQALFNQAAHAAREEAAPRRAQQRLFRVTFE